MHTNISRQENELFKTRFRLEEIAQTIGENQNSFLDYDGNWNSLQKAIQFIECLGFSFENTKFSNNHIYFAKFLKINEEKIDNSKIRVKLNLFYNESNNKIKAAFLTVSDFCIDYNRKKTNHFLN